jgi:hypothetical protein
MSFIKRHIGLFVALTATFVLLLFLPSRSITCTGTRNNTNRPKVNPIVCISTNLKDSTPVLNIWYGSHQVFGRLGVPQRWINILGSVSDPDGISALTFSLNGGKEYPLSIGPDYRRLIAPGDFNIEIDKDLLNIGLNQIAVKATDRLNNQTVRKVTIDYKGNSWPLPYSIDWSYVTNVQDVAQVVDGLWILDRTGIRTHPAHVGYDRVIAIGDMTWKDYEVTVPFIIHAIDASAYESPISIGPSFGINIHWLGHTDSPVICSQPHCGWEPIGGSNWYKFRKNRDNGLRIITGPPATHTDIIDLRLEIGKTYWFKVRVETTPAGNLYLLKPWEDGSKVEPADWTLRKLAENPNLAQGSFLLVAHHVDMTFGNVTVVPLENRSLLEPK